MYERYYRPHGYTFGDVRQSIIEARSRGAVLILEKIKQMAGDLPVIVTGDFNGTVDSEPVTVLTEGGMKVIEQNFYRYLKTMVFL